MGVYQRTHEVFHGGMALELQMPPTIVVLVLRVGQRDRKSAAVPGAVAPAMAGVARVVPGSVMTTRIATESAAVNEGGCCSPTWETISMKTWS